MPEIDNSSKVQEATIAALWYLVLVQQHRLEKLTGLRQLDDYNEKVFGDDNAE